MIDLSFTNPVEPEKAKFLISDPFLQEDYFSRSIIFLCEHNNEGSFGFVINNFISVNLHELDENFPEIETQISIGGPIEVNSLYFIHAFGEQIQNSAVISEGIYLGGDFQELSNLIKTEPALIDKVRFFIGYAGWSAGQLQKEITTNSWVTIDIPATSIFKAKTKQNWKRYMYDLGGKFKIMSKFPKDPNNN